MSKSQSLERDMGDSQWVSNPWASLLRSCWCSSIHTESLKEFLCEHDACSEDVKDPFVPSHAKTSNALWCSLALYLWEVLSGLAPAWLLKMYNPSGISLLSSTQIPVQGDQIQPAISALQQDLFPFFMFNWHKKNYVYLGLSHGIETKSESTLPPHIFITYLWWKY